MAAAPTRRAGVRMIPLDVLRIHDLSGGRDEDLAKRLKCTTRTIRNTRKVAVAQHPGWPNVAPILDERAPSTRAVRAASAVPDPAPPLTLDGLPDLPADPDELEALVGRCMLAAAIGGDATAAKVLLELADRLRKKGAGRANVDPVRAAAEIERAILDATANVVDKTPTGSV